MPLGLVSQWFHGRVAHVLGVDITPAMLSRPNPSRCVSGAPGEALPVGDGIADIVVCRQGTQFMDDAAAIKEMAQAYKKGVVCVINLCAYGESDKVEYFEVLRQRNPVRKLLPREGLNRLMTEAGWLMWWS